MKTAIIHLSDFHFRANESLPREWIDRMVPAIAQVTRHCNHTHLALTGDIAYSGRQAEYESATTFLKAFREAHKTMTGHDPTPLIVPGNHDCDFSSTTDTDDRLRSSVIHDCDSVDEEILATLLRKQHNYRSFATTETSYTHHSATVASWKHPNSNIAVCLLNSALTSSLNEAPGALAIPRNEIAILANATQGHPIVVLMMHHPEAWLDQASRDALRAVVDRHVSIVLTGHEHVGGARADGPIGCDSTVRLAAMAVRDNTGALMSMARVLEVCETTKHVTVHEIDANSHQAKALPPKALKTPVSIGWSQERLSSEYKAKMALSEIPLLLPGGAHATVDDIFVYPDLRAFDGDATNAALVDNLIEQAANQKRIVVCGAPKSGKTCLARRTLIDALKRGFAAVLLDGSRIACRNTESAKRLVHEQVEAQYSTGDIPRFVSTPPGSRLLIIDDFHKLDLTPKQRLAFLGFALAEFEHIVLVATSRHILDEAISSDDNDRSLAATIGSWPRYEIMRFGHEKRAELVDKWVSIGEPTHAAAHHNLSSPRRKMVIEKHLTSVLGRNIVPSYPMWIIMVLTQIDIAANPSANGTSAATLYESMVKLAIGRVVSNVGQIDIFFGFCTHLAGLLNADNKFEISEGDAMREHERYAADMLVDIPYQSVMRDLMSARILERSGNGVRFSFPYLRYYFIARHTCDTLEQDALEHRVDSLIQTVHREESANLLVFMAYFLRGGIIVERLAQRADQLFSDAPRLDLGVAHTELDHLPRIHPQLEVAPGGEEKRRRQALRRMDEEERALAETDSDEDVDSAATAVSQFAIELNAGYRITQIVGQILRAFPGSLTGAAKSRLAAAAVDVALRSAGSLMQQAAEAKTEFVSAFVERTTRLHPSAQIVKVRAAGEATLYELIRSALFNIIRHTSHCLGVESARKVHEVVLGRPELPISHATIRIAMMLDYYGEFPRFDIIRLSEEIGRQDVAMAKDLLIALVWQHLYIYRVEHDAKQSVCSKLGIRISPHMLLTQEK